MTRNSGIAPDKVLGGVKQTSVYTPDVKVYNIQDFQVLQAEQVRAYPNRPGRRNLAQTIKHFQTFIQTICSILRWQVAS